MKEFDTEKGFSKFDFDWEKGGKNALTCMKTWNMNQLWV